MNINVLSKYIILFLLAVIVVLSVLLAVYSAENKALQKANAVLKEQIALRDAAIGEMDKNIKALQQQVQQAEQICNERLKARNDLLTFLSLEPAYNVSKNGTFFPQTPSFTIDLHNGSQTGAETCTAPVQQKNKKNIDYSPLDSSLFVSTNIQNDTGQYAKVMSDEVISKNKSDYAVNAINSYWVQFTQSSYNKK